MKQLLYIIFITCALTGFSQDQEKKGYCSNSCRLFHPTANNEFTDYYSFWDLYFQDLDYGGAFHVDTSLVKTHLITLFKGDSVIYQAEWGDMDGSLCWPVEFNTLSPGDVDSTLTVLEGTPFPIVFDNSPYSGPYSHYSFKQKAVIRNSCLISFRALHSGEIHFVRIIFVDPPQEPSLNVPENTSDISLWLSNENTLTIKADKDASWEVGLYSLSGQLIQKNLSEGSQNLDISNFSRGCYIARITNNTGIEKSLKFIK